MASVAESRSADNEVHRGTSLNPRVRIRLQKQTHCWPEDTVGKCFFPSRAILVPQMHQNGNKLWKVSALEVIRISHNFIISSLYAWRLWSTFKFLHMTEVENIFTYMCIYMHNLCCYKICFVAIYALLTQNLFCCNLHGRFLEQMNQTGQGSLKNHNNKKCWGNTFRNTLSGNLYMNLYMEFCNFGFGLSEGPESILGSRQMLSVQQLPDWFHFPGNPIKGNITIFKSNQMKYYNIYIQSKETLQN